MKSPADKWADAFQAEWIKLQPERDAALRRYMINDRFYGSDARHEFKQPSPKSISY